MLADCGGGGRAKIGLWDAVSWIMQSHENSNLIEKTVSEWTEKSSRPSRFLQFFSSLCSVLTSASGERHWLDENMSVSWDIADRAIAPKIAI